MSIIDLEQLYIVLFLHQTTTARFDDEAKECCISYYSYIKPQLRPESTCLISVVYRTIPTSNHNSEYGPTTYRPVVYRTIPTSNHNCLQRYWRTRWLYIVLFLHQTTTINKLEILNTSCISYYSYIKPQLIILVMVLACSCISYYSYIKPQLLSS